MPTGEQTLRTKTFKDEGLELEKRVFYTLTEGPAPDVSAATQVVAQRNSKAIGLLIQRLHAKKLLTDAEIDALLEECLN